MIYNYYPRIDLQLKQFGAICVSNYITRPQFFRVMNYNKSIWEEKHYYHKRSRQDNVEMPADYLFFYDASDFANKLDLELIPKYQPNITWKKYFYPGFVNDTWEWTADEPGDIDNLDSCGTKWQIIRYSIETKHYIRYKFVKRNKTMDRYKRDMVIHGLTFRTCLPLERIPRKLLDKEWKRINRKTEDYFTETEKRNLDFIEKTLDVKI